MKCKHSKKDVTSVMMYTDSYMYHPTRMFCWCSNCGATRFTVFGEKPPRWTTPKMSQETK